MNNAELGIALSRRSPSGATIMPITRPCPLTSGAPFSPGSAAPLRPISPLRLTRLPEVFALGGLHDRGPQRRDSTRRIESDDGEGRADLGRGRRALEPIPRHRSGQPQHRVADLPALRQHLRRHRPPSTTTTTETARATVGRAVSTVRLSIRNPVPIPVPEQVLAKTRTVPLRTRSKVAG